MEHPCKIWTFYDPGTGALTSRTFSGHKEALKLNTPEGLKAIEGHHDHLSRRVDLQTGEIVDYQPPQASPDHEWDPESRRWRLSQAAQERQRCRAEALARIAALEAAQHRAVREILLKVAPDEAARLVEIETEIVGLRGQVGA